MSQTVAAGQSPAAIWSVSRSWAGETAFLIGGGPSLRGFDASILAGRHVISINNAWELLDSSEVLLFCDKKWWNSMRPPSSSRFSVYKTNGDAVRLHFRGKNIVTISDTRDPLVKRLRNSVKTGLSVTPDALAHGSNGGYQAINLAFLFGAARIVLLGYDMHINGGTHWHSGHGAPVESVAHRIAKTFLPNFKALVEPLKAAGVEVVNATPGSALTLWPFRPLGDILAET